MGWGSIVGGGLGALGGGLLGGPMGAGVGLSLGAALGGGIEGAFDSPDPVNAPYVDPSLYDPEAFNSISADAQEKAAAAAARQGPTADWTQANADRGLAMDSRGRQMMTADELEAFLRGDRASLADQQLRANLERVQQAQINAAANVRGGAGNQLAATQDAARAQLAAGLETNRQGAELRAQEEATARAQLAQLTTAARGQDLQQRGQSQGQAQFDVQAAQNQQGMNDAQQRFFESLRLQGAQGAAQTQQAYGAATQGAQGQVLGINAQREQAAADRNSAMTGTLISSGAQFAGQAYGSGNGGAWGAGDKPPSDDEWKQAWMAGGGSSNSATPWKVP